MVSSPGNDNYQPPAATGGGATVGQTPYNPTFNSFLPADPNAMATGLTPQMFDPPKFQDFNMAQPPQPQQMAPPPQQQQAATSQLPSLAWMQAQSKPKPNRGALTEALMRRGFTYTAGAND